MSPKFCLKLIFRYVTVRETGRSSRMTVPSSPYEEKKIKNSIDLRHSTCSRSYWLGVGVGGANCWMRTKDWNLTVDGVSSFSLSDFACPSPVPVPVWTARLSSSYAHWVGGTTVSCHSGGTSVNAVESSQLTTVYQDGYIEPGSKMLSLE